MHKIEGGRQISNKMYDWRVQSIYQALRQVGKDRGSLEVSDLIQLGHLDQYHYLGVLACDKSIDILGLDEHASVLDVGSGVGGPARYLAHKTGCQITGIELQPSLNDMAIELTRRVGLADKVRYITDDILTVALKFNHYDHFVSWLVFLHIPDKKKLFSTCFNALKPGGTFLIEDMAALNPFTEKETEILKKVIFAPDVPDCDTYCDYLENAGFVNVKFEDLSASWTDWVNDRYQQYISDKAEHIALFGEDVFCSRSNLYRQTVELFNAGNLGGMCITGEKPL